MLEIDEENVREKEHNEIYRVVNKGMGIGATHHPMRYAGAESRLLLHQ